MITFENVSKHYKSGHTALEHINFHVDGGEFVFLMGPSGSGKTTLLRLLLREIEPSAGRVLISGHDVAQLPKREIPKLRRQIGSAFQDFKLIQDKNAFENVSIALDILRKKPAEILETTKTLLEKVGLAEKMFLFPTQLSGGEIQRVAIARAIASNPVLLFADEPTGNLDAHTAREIVRLLESINKAGTTVIMATHDLLLASEFNYRQIHVQNGVLTKDLKPHKTKSSQNQKSSSK